MGVASLLAAVDISNPDKLIEFSPVDLNSAKPSSFPDSFRYLAVANTHLYVTDNRAPVIEIIDTNIFTDNVK